MKKITLIIIVLLFSFGSAFGLDWILDANRTVGWDPVTTLPNGDPIPSGDQVKYKVYVKKIGSTAETAIGETDQVEYQIPFTQEGRFLVGVSTVRYIDVNEDGKIELDNGDRREESPDKSWSDAGGETAPVPFGFELFYALSKPKALVLKP